ncbi:hypothetical protein ACJX0J_022002, partial [Zea mays]
CSVEEVWCRVARTHKLITPAAAGVCLLLNSRALPCALGVYLLKVSDGLRLGSTRSWLTILTSLKTWSISTRSSRSPSNRANQSPSVAEVVVVVTISFIVPLNCYKLGCQPDRFLTAPKVQISTVVSGVTAAFFGGVLEDLI